MSNEIETHRVQRYTDGITLLAQQKMSRLRNRVRVESGVKAKISFFDQIGLTTMTEKTTRHSDTPLIEIPHRRRAVILKFYHTADLIDGKDINQVLNEPAGAYGMTMASAAGRTIDNEIIGAALATSKTGEDGTGTALFVTATHQIVHGSDPLTIGKVLAAKRILDGSEVPRDQTRHAVVTSKQIEDMLNTTEVASSDFNTVKALAQGSISSYCGFEFEQTELVNAVAGSPTVRACLFYAQNSLLLAIGLDIRGRVSERDDKDYSTQVYYSMRVGATRMDEDGVVEVQCQE